MSEENNLQNIKLITVQKPKSQSSEAYRTLRTNIQFSSFDKRRQVILITSTGPGEGKSTVAANLAVVMAESGVKILLIDCDQREPTLHEIFNFSNQKGLSNILAEETDLEDSLKHTEIENLDIMTSGEKPPNPSELLGLKKMEELINLLRDKYEFIILDTPPVLMVTDAQLLSRCSDASILVVSAGEAQKAEAIKAKELLEKVNTKILGVVLNKIEESSKKKYGYYCHNDNANRIKNSHSRNKHNHLGTLK